MSPRGSCSPAPGTSRSICSTESHGDGVAELRTQILVERQWWRLDDPAAAVTALSALPKGSPRAAFLGAQLAYTRLLFGVDAQEGDAAVAEAGFKVAANDPTLSGWGAFWLGVL